MFANHVVVVTGGSSGLGAALVNDFVKNGAKVFFTYKENREKAENIVTLLENQVYAYQADASIYTEAIHSIEECMRIFGRIDILINNAANARDSSLVNSNPENFDYTIKNVLYPVYNYCKAVCEIMILQKSGKIINIGSINGMRGREGSIAYSSAKAGIEGFTKTLAKELGEYNINCNIVAPGFIDTEAQKNTSLLIKKLVLDECAIRKLSKPSDICNMVLFLASDKANNITGQVYQVDCGQYI